MQSGSYHNNGMQLVAMTVVVMTWQEKIGGDEDAKE
jgi:hypothetical protein